MENKLNNTEVVVGVHAALTTTSDESHLGVITYSKRELITSETSKREQTDCVACSTTTVQTCRSYAERWCHREQPYDDVHTASATLTRDDDDAIAQVNFITLKVQHRVEDGLKGRAPSSSHSLQPQSLKTLSVTLPIMCGIFAYMGHQPIPITQVLEALHILESEQEPNELTPVGGHGAGIAYLNQKHQITLTKIGKTNKTQRSPLNNLQHRLPNLTTASSALILGHVRQASPEFGDTIQYAECAQPYKPRCPNNLNIVSAHNGYIQNYQRLRNQLQATHSFESESIKLIDSEIITHHYEEQLAKTQNPTKAMHTLYEQIEGRNTILILHLDTNANQAHINVIQKGKTRGLTTWTNPNNEILICSREKPTQTTFNNFLKENNYQKIIHITRDDSAQLEAHFTLTLNQHTQTSR